MRSESVRGRPRSGRSSMSLTGISAAGPGRTLGHHGYAMHTLGCRVASLCRAGQDVGVGTLLPSLAASARPALLLCLPRVQALSLIRGFASRSFVGRRKANLS